jgi:hypothetical protein
MIIHQPELAMRSKFLMCAVAAAIVPLSAIADDKALELKVVAKTTTFALDTGGKASKEYHKMLEEIAAATKKGERAPQPPRPATVDLKLQIKNTGKDDVTIYVEGDANVFTLELKGKGVVDVRPQLAFTADFRSPKAIKLDAGKIYEIPVKALSDGFRGASRWLYWTEPGEYTIGATYQLATIDGGKGTLLKAEPIKVKVEEKK